MQAIIDRPRFRTDLVAEPIEEGGYRYIDVVDPDTGNGFRFFDVEYSLACAMDGERDLAGLVQWAKEDLGIEPSTKELATVISTLDELGYLASGVAPADGADVGHPELARGVIAAPRASFGAPVEDVELGYAGTHSTPDEPLPRGDFELGVAGGTAEPHPASAGGFAGGPELGAPGAGHGRDLVMEFEAPTPPPADLPSPRLRPVSRPDAEDDGPTNLPRPATGAEFDDDEVSVDLSDHLAISASDVKEAVRASKSMKAVEIPAELAAELDDSSEAQQARLNAAREAAERAQNDRFAAERAAAERAAAERAAAEVARPAVELPRPPVGVSRPKSTSERPPAGDKDVTTTPVTATEAPAQRRGTSLWLVAILLLVIAAAGGWYYWTKVLERPLPWESSDTTTTGASGTGATGGSAGSVEQPPPPPPPPPPPSATLTEQAGTPSEVPAGQVGIIFTTATEGAIVAAGEELVRFRGNPALDRKLVGLDYDIDNRVPKQIADAQKKRSEAAAAGRPTKPYEDVIAERTQRLEQKVADRDEVRAQMESSIVKAPVGGVVSMKIKKGQRTTADQVIATVTPAPFLTATFTLPEGSTLKVPAVDASVRVAVKATPATKANCTVTAVEAPSITVVCPSDAGIDAGTDVVLE